MPFIADIVKHKSLSIVGLEKNTGKTECLNYVLKRLSKTNNKVALTSIGIDGETRDQVKQTPKPEVTIYEGMKAVFVNYGDEAASMYDVSIPAHGYATGEGEKIWSSKVN